MGSINQMEQQLKKDKDALNHFKNTISDCNFMLKMLNRQLPYLKNQPYVKLTVYDDDKYEGYPYHRSITLQNLSPEMIEIFKAFIEGVKSAAEINKKEIEAKYA